MSKQTWKEEVREYIDNTKFATLAYVREDHVPVLRAMGSFVPNGLDLYFTSQKEAAKVKEIAHHQKVSFLFEHPNQTLENWKSVLLIGEAQLLESGDEYDQAVKLLSARNPRFKERVTNGGLAGTAVFKIKTREIQYLDRSKDASNQKYQLEVG